MILTCPQCKETIEPNKVNNQLHFLHNTTHLIIKISVKNDDVDYLHIFQNLSAEGFDFFTKYDPYYKVYYIILDGIDIQLSLPPNLSPQDFLNHSYNLSLQTFHKVSKLAHFI